MLWVASISPTHLIFNWTSGWTVAHGDTDPLSPHYTLGLYWHPETPKYSQVCRNVEWSQGLGFGVLWFWSSKTKCLVFTRVLLFSFADFLLRIVREAADRLFAEVRSDGAEYLAEAEESVGRWNEGRGEACRALGNALLLLGYVLI